MRISAGQNQCPGPELEIQSDGASTQGDCGPVKNGRNNVHTKKLSHYNHFNHALSSNVRVTIIIV